jgi:hypothetical protein
MLSRSSQHQPLENYSIPTIEDGFTAHNNTQSLRAL